MAMSLGVSALSLAIGTLGVMNTVLMSVAERKREIGLLMAVGWKRGRIVALILSEAVVLSSLGGLAGAVVGLVGVECLARFGPLRGKIQGDFSLDLVLGAVAIAAAFGLIGGLLPSLRAAGLRPSDTMRDGG
jgi:putative ABC transport system permease protein